MPPRRLTGLRFNQPSVARHLFLLACMLLLSACGGLGGGRPTRTPVPTWTPTPMGALGALPAAGAVETVAPVVPAIGAPAAVPPTAGPSAAQVAPVESAPPAAMIVAATPTPATGLVTATPIPTATPTPVATATPLPPTATPTPVPTATPDWPFLLEEATQFPTVSLASNVVRIWLYVYSPAELALGGYSLAVRHNGKPLTVDEVSFAGIPEQTRAEPGPFTRFTNLNVIYIEPQGGIWEVQLVDASGAPMGPLAVFQLGDDQLERELYVRYKQVRPL